MRLALLVLLLSTMTLASGFAKGGGTIHTSVLVVYVEDSHGQHCRVPVAEFCFFEITGSEPSSTRLDAAQHIGYVGVATNFSQARQIAGDAWVLPEVHEVIKGSELFIPHPVMRIATEWWNEQDRPAETNFLEMSPNNFTITTVEPAWDEPKTESKVRSFEYGGGFEYEQLGPYNTDTGGSTDDYLQVLRDWSCEGDDSCDGLGAKAFDTIGTNTPDVVWGLEWYDVEFAMDPGDLAITRTAGMAIKNASIPFVPSLRENLTLERHGSPSEFDLGRGEPQSVPAPPPTPKSPIRPDTPLRISDLDPPREAEGNLLSLIAGAALVTAILALIGFALYSRFTNRAEALQSETRNKILAIIRESPGICLSDTAERLGVARNTIRHHLRVLERVQLVRVAKEGNLQVFYPAGAEALQVPPWLRRNETCLAILRAVAQSATGLPREEIRRLLPELPDRTRNYHLKRMLSVGALVQAEDESGEPRLRVAPQWVGQGGTSGTA